MVVVSCFRDVGNASFVIAVVFLGWLLLLIDGSIICVLSCGSLVSGCSPFPMFLGELLSDFCLV